MKRTEEYDSHLLVHREWLQSFARWHGMPTDEPKDYDEAYGFENACLLGHQLGWKDITPMPPRSDYDIEFKDSKGKPHKGEIKTRKYSIPYVNGPLKGFCLFEEKYDKLRRQGVDHAIMFFCIETEKHPFDAVNYAVFRIGPGDRFKRNVEVKERKASSRFEMATEYKTWDGEGFYIEDADYRGYLPRHHTERFHKIFGCLGEYEDLFEYYGFLTDNNENPVLCLGYKDLFKPYGEREHVEIRFRRNENGWATSCWRGNQNWYWALEGDTLDAFYRVRELKDTILKNFYNG